ncbi:MAG TPA: DNA-directed RNA polymerase subunit B'' [Candidatus Nanoarchaeia archaeon]|nr:DNA-directed RNA polymerase subunit B'' [Candidatus Nanoarchaeia archaeon]
MYKYGKVLVQKYFDEQSFVDSDIDSFNRFMDKELNIILEENKEIVPTIIPHNIDEFKIKLDKIWSIKPEITEADGSKRNIFPMEARLRKLTYSAPTFIEVRAHINGVQRESFVTQVGNVPIMLKSKWCHLHNMNREELIENGEDPDEPGGYFIINGTEKVLITIEDLASNKFLIEQDVAGTSQFVGKLFSEYGSFKIPHTMEKLKDGMFYLTFTRVKRIPIIVLIKALGMLKDEEIIRFVSESKQYDEVILNLIEFAGIKTEDDAIDYIAKKVGITQSKDVRLERMREILDKYLMPHIGIKKEDRIFKAYNLCKMIKKFVMASRGDIGLDDKDHYMNKRLKLAGDLLGDLLRLNLKVLIGDLLYNFQRIVKRGKFPSIKVIIRDKLLTQRIYSSMATGTWVSGRKGISQRIQRLNYLETLSHLQRVVSPLSASQENFEARELHSTHLGRLCPIETPEGTNIGLRKNLALLCSISRQSDENEIMKQLTNFGLKTIR